MSAKIVSANASAPVAEGASAASNNNASAVSVNIKKRKRSAGGDHSRANKLVSDYRLKGAIRTNPYILPPGQLRRVMSQALKQYGQMESVRYASGVLDLINEAFRYELQNAIEISRIINDKKSGSPKTLTAETVQKSWVIQQKLGIPRSDSFYTSVDPSCFVKPSATSKKSKTKAASSKTATTSVDTSADA